jgi:hypothetical protein
MRAGFITEAHELHDWHDYAGKLMERRERNRERMRATRATPVDNSCSARATHSARTCSATEPNRTIQNQPLSPLAVAVAPAVVGEGDFERWWETYGRVGSKADARELYRYWRREGASTDELLRAADAYREHCSAPGGPKIAHGRTFLAKKPCRWREWADGELHGSMDVREANELGDVLAAGLRTFNLGADHDRALRSTTHSRIGADARRGLPAGGMADEE